MPRELTLDIETVDSFADVGKYDPTLLHVSLVGVYDSGNDTYRSYLCEYRKDDRGQWERDDAGRLRLERVSVCDYRMEDDGAHGRLVEEGGWRETDGLTGLWQMIQAADRVIGYNILNFDYGVMDRYYPGSIYQSVRERREQRPRFKTLDLMIEIEKSLGFRAKLDDVAAATLGLGKTGHGLQAIEFYRKGEFGRLSDYCLHDVKVTWDVYRVGLEKGQVRLKDRMGQMRDVPVDFKFGEKKAVEMTLF
jgi:DEAD/DEAH box helicase domain-containing protein